MILGVENSMSCPFTVIVPAVCLFIIIFYILLQMYAELFVFSCFWVIFVAVKA